MVVLKHGPGKEDRVFHCEMCKCVFQASWNDVEANLCRPNKQSITPYYFVRCPDCRNTIDLSSGRVVDYSFAPEGLD